MVTVNGKSYAASDFLNGGHVENVVAGTGETLPRFLAAIADALADAARARSTTSATSKSAEQTGSQSFVLAEDVSFAVGAYFTAASRSTPSVSYLCQVTGYVSGTKTLTGTVIASTGAGGPYTDWDIMVAGPKGDAGPVRERNRIINGTFAIQQRLAAGSTDNSYGLDRWRLLLEAANAATVAQDTADTPTRARYAAKLVVGSGNNNKFGLFQPIAADEMWDLRGQTVSVRVPLKATAGLSNIKIGVLQFVGTADAISGDPISSWGADGTNPTLATNWSFANTPANKNVTTSWSEYLEENVSISASATNLALLIWNDDKTTTQTTDILRVGGYVWLGAGSAAPSIILPSFEQELAACRLYYQLLGGSATFVIGQGFAKSTTVAQAGIVFDRMRKAPSATASASNALIVNAGGSVGNASSAISLSNVSPSTALIEATTTGITQGDGAVLYANTANDYIALDAEL